MRTLFRRGVFALIWLASFIAMYRGAVPGIVVQTLCNLWAVARLYFSMEPLAVLVGNTAILIGCEPDISNLE